MPEFIFTLFRNATPVLDHGSHLDGPEAFNPGYHSEGPHE